MNQKFIADIAACIFGALVGGLLAFLLADWLGWEIAAQGVSIIAGAFAGGGIAYLAGEGRELCLGVKRAWQKTIDWQPDREYWKTYFLLLCGISLFYSSVGIGVSIFFYLADFPWGSYVGIWTLLFAAAAMAASIYPSRDPEVALRRQRWGWKMIYEQNPLSVCVSALVYFLVFLIWTYETVPGAAKAMKSRLGRVRKTLFAFMREAFIAIHSEPRTIRFAAASLGIVVGCAIGYPLRSVAAVLITGAFAAAVFYVGGRLIAGLWLKTLPIRNGS